MKIGCIGTGAMGGAIMRAVCKKYDVSQIKVTDKNTQMGKAFAQETGAVFVETNKDDVTFSPLLLPCQQIWQRYGNIDTRQLAAYAEQLKEYFK